MSGLVRAELLPFAQSDAVGDVYQSSTLPLRTTIGKDITATNQPCVESPSHSPANSVSPGWIADSQQPSPKLT
jgi:hypothetical protein